MTGIHESPDTRAADSEVRWLNLLTRDQKDLPNRPWVIPGLLMRRVVTIIAGHGGSGKSVLTLFIALGGALGQKFAEYAAPANPLNVLIVNAEDSADEMDLRLEAALTAFEGNPAELRKLASPRLHTVKRHDYHIVAREPEGIVETKFCQALISFIEEREIGLLIFDPAISAHSGLDENRSEMQVLIEKFRVIADVCDIPVVLVSIRAPMLLAQDFLALMNRCALRVLRGIAETPFLRADSSVVAQEGYDEHSQMILDTNGAEFDPVQDKPSKEDAKRAIAEIDKCLGEFPFDGNPDGKTKCASRTVALSLILSALAVGSLDHIPMHLGDAAANDARPRRGRG